MEILESIENPFILLKINEKLITNIRKNFDEENLEYLDLIKKLKKSKHDLSGYDKNKKMLNQVLMSLLIKNKMLSVSKATKLNFDVNLKLIEFDQYAGE